MLTLLIVVLIVVLALAVVGYRCERASVNRHEDLRAALTQFEHRNTDAGRAAEDMANALGHLRPTGLTVTLGGNDVGRLTAPTALTAQQVKALNARLGTNR